MASETILKNNLDAAFPAPAGEVSLASIARLVVAPLASLRFTVALFAMSIFIIFAGTLAQVDKDIWEVVDQYFRVPVWPNLGFAWIDLQIFAILIEKSFSRFVSMPVEGLHIPGGFYFPGGWLIGAMMFVNLVAAHSLRFTVQAKGTRLGLGIVVLAVGALMTWLVIASGSNKDGIQEAIWSDWSKLAFLFKIGLGVLWVVTLYATGLLILKNVNPEVPAAEKPRGLTWLMIVFSSVLSAVVAWILIQGEAAH